jgi:hypothetical protein
MRAQTNVVFILAGILLIGFSMLSMLGFIMESFGYMSDKSIEKMCRSSIENRVLTSAQTTEENTFSFGGLSCRKQDLKFTPSAIYQDAWFSNIIFTEDKIEQGQKESIMRKFAESMASCKYTFADNRHEDVFSSLGSEFWELFGIDENKPKCFTCYSVAVKEFDYTITTQEFHEFLLTEELSPGITYSDYLQGGGNLGGDGAALLVSDIQNDGLYGISYFGRNSDGGVPVDMAEVGEKALSMGTAGLILGTGAAVVAVSACVIPPLTVALCLPAGAAIGATINTVLISSLAGAGMSYQHQIKAESLYGNTDSLLDTRTYGYFVLDEMETLQHVGCKEQ